MAQKVGGILRRFGPILQCRCILTSSIRLGKDYYAILGVDRQAAPKEIKSRFVELSKKLHPDLNPDVPSATFVELNEAYTMLSNSHRRHQYDLELANELANRTSGYSGARGWSPANPGGQGWSGSVGKTYSATGAYAPPRADYRFTNEQGYYKNLKSKNSKMVVYMLIVLVVGTTLHILRIQSNHKMLLKGMDERNHKVNNIYNDVCSQAKERSLQEQLDKLREKHSSRLEKVKGQKG